MAKIAQDEEKGETCTRKSPLDKIAPDMIFKQIFLPYIWTTKFLGVLPLIIEEDGRVSFRTFSWSTFYYLGFFALFIFDSCFYVPFVFSRVSSVPQNQNENIAFIN